MLHLPEASTEKLETVESRLRSLRDEKTRALKVAEAAKASVAAVPEDSDDTPQYQAAQAAVDAVKAIQAEIDLAQSEQTALLKTAGGPTAWSSGDGWADAARRLDLNSGALRVDLAGGSLLRPMAVTTSNVEHAAGARSPSFELPLQPPTFDARFLYQGFPQQALDPGDLAVVDFKLTSEADAVSGVQNVERDPLAVTDKAVLDVDLDLTTTEVRQFALTIDDVPAKLFESHASLGAFLTTHGRYALDRALDAHVISTINAASPPSGSTGTGLIAQVRNGISSMRALGANPTLLALNPTDAAALDLHTSGADDAYTFATRGVGSAAPLWGLAIGETPSVTDPLLIDPARAAVLYLGGASILADPYSGLKKNVVTLRIEYEALFVVRDANGIREIS